ncbi:hypothetical protein CRUP_005890 [Coryphaenoides rupestris]|nr:hypothetical protein CRUP_005890 [Coryphaenoides rupestris]
MADPDRRDPRRGLTVAHDAARDGFGDTVRVLVDCGADVNLVDARGNLPLHLAARGGHTGVVALLMGRTAQPELHNSQGRTAHDLALQGGHVESSAASTGSMHEGQVKERMSQSSMHSTCYLIRGRRLLVWVDTFPVAGSVRLGFVEQGDIVGETETQHRPATRRHSSESQQSYTKS